MKKNELRQDETKLDNNTNDEANNVCQHNAKPLVVCSHDYETILSLVQKLEDEFNYNLISILKSSKEELVIGIADWSHGRMRASHITNPVCIIVTEANEAAKSGARQTPRYGNGIIKIGLQQILG